MEDKPVAKKLERLVADPLVEILAPDPTVPPTNVEAFEGFLGRSSREGHWRLYLVPALDEYLEVAEEDVLFVQKSDSTPALFTATVLFVRSQAQIMHVQVEAIEAQTYNARQSTLLLQRCTQSTCKYFRQFHVGPGGKPHVYKCNQSKCKYYTQFHVGEKPHIYKCTQSKCKFYLQFHVGVKPHVYT